MQKTAPGNTKTLSSGDLREVRWGTSPAPLSSGLRVPTPMAPMAVPQAPAMEHPPELPCQQHRGDVSRAAAMALQQPLPASGPGSLLRAIASLLQAAVVRKEDSSSGLNQHKSYEVRQIHEN